MASHRHILRTLPLAPPAAGLRSTPDRPLRAGRTPSRTRAPRTAAAPRSLRAVTRRFLRCERASAAIEGAVAMSVLFSAFAGLMGFVSTIYTDDQMGRGARTVARALALDPNADPWAAFRREVDLDLASCTRRSDGVSFDSSPGNVCDQACTVCEKWTLTIDHGVSPKSLETVFGGGTASDGEMILVKLEKEDSSRQSFGLARREPEE